MTFDARAEASKLVALLRGSVGTDFDTPEDWVDAVCALVQRAGFSHSTPGTADGEVERLRELLGNRPTTKTVEGSYGAAWEQEVCETLAATPATPSPVPTAIPCLACGLPAGVACDGPCEEREEAAASAASSDCTMCLQCRRCQCVNNSPASPPGPVGAPGDVGRSNGESYKGAENGWHLCFDCAKEGMWQRRYAGRGNKKPCAVCGKLTTYVAHKHRPTSPPTSTPTEPEALRDPLSIECDACLVQPGEPCVENIYDGRGVIRRVFVVPHAERRTGAAPKETP